MRRAAAVAALFLALAAFFAWPLSAQPGRRALDLGGDTRLFLWTIGWDLHALSTGRPLFDANIFFPARNALAYSENLIGLSLLAAPFQAATGNLLLAMNAAALLSVALCGMGAFFLGRQLGLGVWGALAAGLVYAFAPPRLMRLGQLHQVAVQWIPFCLAFMHRYLHGGVRGHLWIAGAFFVLQAATSGHGALFLALALALLVGYRWLLSPEGRPRRFLRDLALVGAAAALACATLFWPYVRASREGLRRDLMEVKRWSPNAASFVASPTHLHRVLLGPLEAERSARAYLFPGLLPLALATLALRRRPTAAEARRKTSRAVLLLDSAIVLAAVTALLAAARGPRWQVGPLALSLRDPLRPLLLMIGLAVARVAVAGRATSPLLLAARRTLAVRTGADIGFYVLLAAVSSWLALGPEFGLFAIFHRFVPGFDLIRVPSRWFTPTMLALGVLAGAGLDRVRRRPVTLILLVGLAAEFTAVPLDAPPYTLELPAVDRWLAGQPRPFALVELPVADPRDEPRASSLQSRYMLHSIAHWQPTVNGYSGFTPPGHDLLFRKLAGFPDEASLTALESLGVRYVVVHREFYRPGEWPAVEQRLASGGHRLERVAEVEEGLVLRLPDRRPPRH